MRRTAAVLSALTLVLISCTENPIESAGQGSTDWIGQGAPSTLSTVPAEVTTTTAPTAPRVELVASVGLNWLNDGLATFHADTPLEVSELVWDASSGADGFVQAHRNSISRALPGLKFPAAVPDDISHITSQLVFELPMGAMTDDWTAAFGFWTVPPYSESRSIGQSAVLRVGFNEAAGIEGALTGCTTLLVPASIGCSDIIVAGLGDAAEVVTDDGVRLSWVDGDYRYELFYRTFEDVDVAGMMAGSMVELTDLETRAVQVFRGMVSRLAVASSPSG